MADVEQWRLHDRDDEVVLDDVEATSAEMLIAVEAADARREESAPHYATNDGGDVVEGRTLDEDRRRAMNDLVDEVLEEGDGG